jgi:bacterioferritin (cytochrome b1)
MFFNTKAFIEKHFAHNKLINQNNLTSFSMFFTKLSKDTIFKAQKLFVIRRFLFLYL